MIGISTSFGLLAILSVFTLIMPKLINQVSKWVWSLPVINRNRIQRNKALVAVLAVNIALAGEQDEGTNAPNVDMMER